MNKIRIIPRLDVKGPNVVKGIQLEGLRVVGNPFELAQKYYEQGADELVYMDIVASLYNRNNLSEIIEETTRKGLFIPITVGGGIRSLEDIRKILRAGADKVAINTAAIKNPSLLKEAAEVFGSSTIVLSVEAKKVSPGNWEAYTDNGRECTGRNVIEWVTEAQELGIGEVLLTSVDHEGRAQGYDIKLVQEVAKVVKVPLVISGGVGNINHLKDVMAISNVDGLSMAHVLHYNKLTVSTIKDELNNERINHQTHSLLTFDRYADKTVSIIDYGLCNLRSVAKAFEYLGAKVKLIDQPKDILDAQYLVLPGVGAFGRAMDNLNEQKLVNPIREYAQSGRPLLGICLGMQLLMSQSMEFGKHQGLGIIEGEVLGFADGNSSKGFKIPHVGWNSLEKTSNCKSTILENISDNSGVYFVHSFYVKPKHAEHVLTSTRYFDHVFCSTIAKGNIYGCQYHPEKSGKTGIKILHDFLNIQSPVLSH